MSLSKFDFIGGTPIFYVNGSTNHQTKVGGILTIIALFLSVLCFAGFGLDLFERKRAEILNSKQ